MANYCVYGYIGEGNVTPWGSSPTHLVEVDFSTDDPSWLWIGNLTYLRSWKNVKR